MTKIKNLQELKDLSSEDGGCECFISLAEGLSKSSKHVWYYPESNTWDWYNDIDGTDFEDMGMDVMMNETNIMKALDSGTLYAY